MEVSNQPKLQFHGVDIVNVNFSSTDIYNGKSEIDLKVEPSVFYPSDNDKIFKIFMEVKLSCDKYFELFVVGIGNFELEFAIEDKDLKKIFVNSNAPAIMFPYMRSFISTLTSNIGHVTGPLVIPTQFFRGDLQEICQEEN